MFKPFKFVESTFSMAQENLRVNGHNFGSFDAAGQGKFIHPYPAHFAKSHTDMEAFDEALDRRIWSLADTRLQWHKRMAKTRREVPKEIQSRISDLMKRSQAQDLDIFQNNDTLNDDDGEILDGTPFPVLTSTASFATIDPVPISTDVIEDFHLTSATTEELNQVR